MTKFEPVVEGLNYFFLRWLEHTRTPTLCTMCKFVPGEDPNTIQYDWTYVDIFCTTAKDPSVLQPRVEQFRDLATPIIQDALVDLGASTLLVDRTTLNRLSDVLYEHNLRRQARQYCTLRELFLHVLGVERSFTSFDPMTK